MLRIIQEIIIVFVGLALCLEHLNVNLGFFILTPSKAVNALLLVVAALEWAARRHSAPHDRKAIWMAFFGLAVVVGALQSGFLGGMSMRSALVIGQQYASLLMFYFILTFVLADERRHRLLFGAFVVSAVLVTLSAALGFGVQTAERLGGWGGNVNHLAQNLLVAICGTYALYLTARTHFWRAVLVGAMLISIFGLINTFSRAAFLAVPFMLMMWMIRFRRLGTLRYALPAVAVLAIGFLFLPESVVDRIATLNPDEIEDDSSAMSRVDQFYWAFRAILSNPISGIGLANFHFWTAERGIYVGGVHNMYLRVFSDLGLIGFVPLMAIILLSWRDFTRSFTIARRLRHHGDAELRWIEMQALMYQIALQGVLFIALFHPTGTKKSLWMLFALSTTLWRLVRERYLALESESQPATPRWDPLQPMPVPALRSTR